MKTVEYHLSCTASLGYRLLVAVIVIGLLVTQNVTILFAHGAEENEPNNIYLPAMETGATSEMHHDHAHVHDETLNYDPNYIPSAEDHFNEDYTVIDPATEAQLAPEMRPGYGMRAVEVAAVDPGIGGSWSAVQTWPILGTHAHLLPNGKVLAFDSTSDIIPELNDRNDSTRAILWDPATKAITRVDAQTGWNIFCSGHALLPDGKLYVAGGVLNSNIDGLDKTFIFNTQNNQWSIEGTMSVGRWYPTVTALPNGEMLITAGRIRKGLDATQPEIRSTTGNLRTLTGASLTLPFYPWMQTTPSGKVLVVGPASAMHLLNTSGTGSWQSMGNRDGVSRSAGSFAMYDIGKFLSAGGSNSKSSVTITNINSGTAVNTPTGSMAFGRRHFDLTVLADGTVLATGGNSSGTNHVDMNAGVYAAEVWNPATGKWTTLNSMQVTRQYHSTALLLPDGRVLTSGGGLSSIATAAGYMAKSAEVFSPPYLYKKDGSGQLAARPVINSAPSTAGYNATFTVQMASNSAIQKVALVRLGSVTHSVNMEQRFIPLNFTQASATLQVTSPANGNIAPLGYYMLFVINSSGVPSLSKMVQVVSQTTPPQNDLIFADGFEAGNLTAWSSRVADGGDLAALPAASLVGSYGMRAQIDDNNALAVIDDRPNAERRYRARFHFDPNSITMLHADSHNLFRGYVGNSLAVLTMDLRYYNSKYQVRAGLLNDSTTWRFSTWFDLTDTPHALEIDWLSAANNGALTFWIDGVQRSQLTGVDNDTRQIDRVRLGAISGIDTGTRGIYYFDAFQSGRLNYMGPAAGTLLSTASASTLGEPTTGEPTTEGTELAELYAWTEEEMTAEDMQAPSETSGLYLPLLSD